MELFLQTSRRMQYHRCHGRVRRHLIRKCIQITKKNFSILLLLLLFIFNCNWVDTRWQQYSTHLHTKSTQNNTICLLTAIGLTPGDRSTVHIYTQTVHRIQRTEHT
jgi:hypothetical protein